MFERFTDRARRVVVLAQEEARMLNHNYIGTEHLLLGLAHEGEGVAARALAALKIDLAALRQQVEEIIGQGKEPPSGHIPFTPRAKKVLELSLREALQLGHDYIGTEHVLLGLIREGEGVAAQVLVRLGADLNRVRQQVLRLLEGGQGEAGEVGVHRSPLTRDFSLAEIRSALTSIAARLTAIERHLGMMDRPSAAAASGDPSAAAPGGGPEAAPDDRPAAAPGDPPAAAPGGGPAAASDDPPAVASDDPPAVAPDDPPSATSGGM
jgi:ATP-dependent Clp protease ATP-binding subunit ClpA